MKVRLAGIFVLGAGLAMAGPDGSCTISQTGILSPQTKVTRGVATSIAVTTTGCSTPLRDVQLATGTLPPGLTLTAGASGATITGTPTTPGVYVFALRAIDAAYRLPNESAIIQVNDPLQIDTPAAATGAPSAAYIDTIRARGGSGPYAFSIVEGALPTGLTLDAATGAISGTMPAAGSKFRIRVTDSSSPANTAEKAFTIVPSGQVTTVSTPPVGSTGSPYSFDIDGALGTAGFALALGALPPGLTMDTNGVISGTPTTVGEYHFTVRQTVSTASVWRSYRVFINSAGTVTGTPRNAEELASYNHAFGVSGGVAPFSYAITTGALPTGLTLNAATGAITGTLPLSASGTAFTVTATDASGRSYALATSITTVTQLSGSGTTPPTVRVPLSRTFTPYSLSAGGPGKQFKLIGGVGDQQVFIDPVTGSTQYSFAAPGTFTPIVLGTDSLGGAFLFSSVQYKAVGNLALDKSSEIPNAIFGTPYSTTLAVNNGDFTPLSFAVTGGTLPTGFTLGAATGILSGNPDPMEGNATFTFQVTVTDSAGQTAIANYFLGIGSAARITSTSLPAGTIGQSYSGQLQSAGGFTPLFDIPPGLPPGLTMNTSGAITGIPTTAGDYTILVHLTDEFQVDSKEFTIHVAAAPSFTVTPATQFEATLKSSLFLPITQTGGRAPFTVTVSSGSLPDGLFMQQGSSLGINGVPMISGNQSFLIQLQDADGRIAFGVYGINVRENVLISTDTLPTATRNVPYNAPLTATLGSSPYTWSFAGGTLPPGLTISSGGAVTGTPTTNGVYNFTVLATDNFSRGNEKNFTLEINDALAITSAAPLPNGLLQNAYNQTITTSGGQATKTFSIFASDLAPLLAIHPSTGAITGLPLLSGTYPFTVQVQDSLGRTATQAQQVTIQGSLAFTPTTVPNGTVGTPYSVTFVPTGAVGAVAWSVSAGALPAGLTLGPSTGVLSGTPTTPGAFNFTIQALDSTAVPVTQSYSGQILNVLTIAPATLADAPVNAPYSVQLTASGGSGAVGWSVTAGALPPGMNIGVTSGLLDGTPTTVGSYSFTVTATDSFSQTGSRAYTLLVLGTLPISPATLPNATVGTGYSQQLSVTGASGAVNWIVSAGALPSGLTLGASTGAITGTPSVNGTFNFTVTATDSLTQAGSRVYNLTVLNVLTISPATVANGTVGTAYSQQLTAAGGSGSISWAVTAGALPAGLSLGPVSGAITGTPTASGSFAFTVAATDSLTQSGSRAYTMTVAGVLTVAPATVANGTVGTAYSQQLTATGGTGAVSWAVTAGALPAGLTLGPTSGAITGTPTVSGSFSFTVTATDSISQAGSQAYTMTVAAVLNIAPVTVPNGTTGTAYSQQLTATGGTGAVGWAVTAGALPAGLTLGPTSGAITGTPTVSGSFAFTVTATDSISQTGSRAYTMSVAGVLTIAPATVANGTVGTSYLQQLTASGGTGAIAWAVTAGALPAGLTLGPTSGAITGTPTASGSFAFTVTATDSISQTGSLAYTMTVAGLITVAPNTVPNGTVGTSYLQQLTATGGTGAISWAVTSGALPGGLALGPTSGAITGTPTGAGSFSFTVTATDSLSQAGSRAYSMTVAGVLTIAPATVPNGTVGTAYSQQLTVTGGTGAIGWAVTTGALPGGLTLSPTTGLISGTPTAAGTFGFTVTATDSLSQTGTRTYSLQVLNVLTITPATLPNGIEGTQYLQTLSAGVGASAVNWTVSAGALPAGLTLGPTNGQIGGTPTTPGSYTFTITATDSLSQTGSRAYTVTIAAQLTITPATLATVYVGVPFSQTLTAANAAGAVTWSISSIAGGLPAGLTLSPTTGVISGTTNVTPGNYTVTVQATDAQSQAGQQTYTVRVRQPITIAPPTLPDATLGTAYSQTLTATNAAGATSFAVTGGALPGGLALNATTGVLSGTPTALGTFTFDVSATTSQQQAATRSYTLKVVDPLAFSTTTLPDGTEQEVYLATLTANAASTSGLTWSIPTGVLPPGLALNSATGDISGTPTRSGTYAFTAQVVNLAGTRATQGLSITVVPVLVVTSISLGDAVQGRSFTSTLTAIGGRTPYTWTLVNSSLPAGLTLNPATGQVTGTTSVPEGTYPQNVVVTDSRGRVARRTVQLSVSPPPPPSLAIAPETLPGGRVNQAYSATFSATGGVPGYTFTLAQGSLPPGLTLINGVLSGTPTQDGTYRFTVNANDSQSRVAGNLYTVVIEPALTPLSVTPASIAPTAPIGQALTLQFGATGGRAPYTFAITGNVPPGMSSNSSGVLSGTPSQGGTFAFTVEATDSTGVKANRSYSLTVTGNLTITTQPPLAEGTVGKGYTVTFGVAGGRAPYTWTASGTLPPGLTFDSGTLSGTPTTAGTFTFTIGVQDSQRLSASAPFSITVWDPVTITNAPADTALISGQPFNFTFTTRGGKPPVTLAVSGGALPGGLTMTPTGAISGTPVSAGTFSFTVVATDALGNTALQSATLRVLAPLTITTTSLPSGTVGAAYTAGVAATGGQAPLGAWSVSQGALPAGLALGADGTISGTPTAAGTATFTVRISDANGTVATRILSIAVQLPPVPPLVVTGLPQTLPPGTQTNITIQLAQPFPVPVTGTLTLIFEPNAVNNADDPSVQFSSGGRTVTFTIPAGQTVGTFPVTPLRLLSGTVAGTIRIQTTTSPASATPVPDAVVPITRSAPVITAGTAQVGTNSFTLTIDGFSNTREISSATFRLTPAAGSSLATTDVPVSVAATFSAYYQSSSSAPFGGQFRLVLPFTVNGLLTDIDTVVVTVTNSVGTSQPFTVRLR